MAQVKGKVVPLHFWEVYRFPWGAAVKERRANRWVKIYLHPDGQEIDVSKLRVTLHQNGIEFAEC